MQRAVEFFGYEMKIKLVANIFYWNSSRFRSFLCRNFSFYFVLVFWITIILLLVLWKRRPIILVFVLIFVTKITLLLSVTLLLNVVQDISPTLQVTVLNWFKSYLSSRIFRVKCDNAGSISVLRNYAEKLINSCVCACAVKTRPDNVFIAMGSLICASLPPGATCINYTKALIAQLSEPPVGGQWLTGDRAAQ